LLPQWKYFYFIKIQSCLTQSSGCPISAKLLSLILRETAGLKSGYTRNAWRH